MDKRALMIYNGITVLIVLSVGLVCWFRTPEHLMWAIILAVLLLALALWVNGRKMWPWEGLNAYDAAYAAATLLIIGFSLFFMRSQCLWWVLVVLVIMVLSGLRKKKD